MERWNSEGLPRDSLAWALRQARFVMAARAEDRCLLCRREEVNEAGLCRPCMALLDDEELDLATRWLSGVAP